MAARWDGVSCATGRIKPCLGTAAKRSEGREAILRGAVMKVVLASASPRRRELLGLLLRDFSCCSTDIDESLQEDEAPPDYVCRMAREKAAAARTDDALVIAADTTVTLDGAVLGKPSDAIDAARMLANLSGRAHRVLTSVCVAVASEFDTVLCETRVTFAQLSTNDIELYLQTDEPWDKAGGYGIQGRAGSFVASVEGSYSAVVGLPLAETRGLLAKHGILPQW